jgi:hypothetical protein
MPISQPLKAPDTDVQLDLIFIAGYLGQKHRWPVPISNEGVCLRAVSGLLLKGEKK